MARTGGGARGHRALIGAFALALHGVVRATKDIDLLIGPTLDNARRALAALEKLTYGIAREIEPADVVSRPITIVGDDPRLDLLTIAWSARYADAAPGMLRTRIEDVEIPYADLDTLIRSKQTGRLQDRADLETLEQLRRLR